MPDTLSLNASKEREDTLVAFTRLSDILDRLRRECPWDSVQTIQSLRYLTIEEVYELSDAIVNLETNGNDDLKKELGDIIMHIIFYSKIAEDEGRFTLKDVLDAVCDKLMVRHPHIFGANGDLSIECKTMKDNLTWEQLKMREGRKSVMEGVSAALPALDKAVRIQEKASGIGFDFATADEAFCKVKEEYDEFVESGSEDEFGDLLFALVKWGAMRGINADDALSKTNTKFIRRFQQMEQAAASQGKTIAELSPSEMLALWNEKKNQL